MKFETVIGLEVHAQLSTDSKIFCTCSAKFGADQNTHVCPICLAMPGVLPVMNRKAVDFAIKMGLATHCTISQRSIMARKNYFYPDLPKGYQISQYEEPLCKNGFLEVETEGVRKKIRLNRIHLEEDAGKSIHAEEFVGANETLVDLNRCGVPLIEIVSEPDMSSPREAFLYLNQLRQILQYLEICDGNMDQGSLRCDANVSLRPVGETRLGTSTELKNMNTFHGIEKALGHEIKRQERILRDGGRIVKETLLWDAAQSTIVPMRSKELAHDYRYFPDPDLVPIEVDADWVARMRSQMPELPVARTQRFVDEFGLTPHDAEILTDTRPLADYFEACLTHHSDAKLVSNWVMGKILRVLNDRKISINQLPVRPENLARLLVLIQKGTVSDRMAKTVFDQMVETGEVPEAIVQKSGLTQVSDESEIEAMVDRVLDENPKELARYLSGKTKLYAFFVGQVMKLSRGKANPKVVNACLTRKIELRRGA